MNIVVLAGGISSERDVSLSSGATIYRALKEKGHKVILLDVYLGYEWVSQEEKENKVTEIGRKIWGVLPKATQISVRLRPCD